MFELVKSGIAVSKERSESFTIDNIPVGKKRVLLVNDADSCLKLYALVEIKEGENKGVINKNTSFLGKLYAELINRNIETEDVDDILLSEFIDRLSVEAGHFLFIDYEKVIADFISGSITEQYDDYILSPFTVVFNAPTDGGVNSYAYVNDPVSARSGAVVEGVNSIIGVSPGVYKLFVYLLGDMIELDIDTSGASDNVIDAGSVIVNPAPYINYADGEVITAESHVTISSDYPDAVLYYSLDNINWSLYEEPFLITETGDVVLYCKSVISDFEKISSVNLEVIPVSGFEIVATFTDWTGGPRLPIKMEYDGVNDIHYAEVKMYDMGMNHWVPVWGHPDANIAFKIRHVGTYIMHFGGESGLSIGERELILPDHDNPVIRTKVGDSLSDMFFTAERYAVYRFELKIDDAGDNHILRIVKTGVIDESEFIPESFVLYDDFSDSELDINKWERINDYENLAVNISDNMLNLELSSSDTWASAGFSVNEPVKGVYVRLRLSDWEMGTNGHVRIRVGFSNDDYQSGVSYFKAYDSSPHIYADFVVHAMPDERFYHNPANDMLDNDFVYIGVEITETNLMKYYINGKVSAEYETEFEVYGNLSGNILIECGETAVSASAVVDKVWVKM